MSPRVRGGELITLCYVFNTRQSIKFSGILNASHYTFCGDNSLHWKQAYLRYFADFKW